MKAAIQQHRGELDAAETACAEQEIDMDERTPTPSSTSSLSRKRPQDMDRALLESLQKRVAESGAILKDLSKAQQQPAAASQDHAGVGEELPPSSLFGNPRRTEEELEMEA